MIAKLTLVGALLASTLAHAEAPSKLGSRRLAVHPTDYAPDPALAERLKAPAALSGHTIWLNRCIGGCQMKPGADDMGSNPIPSNVVQSPVTIAQATDITEEEWAGLVQCVKEIYSPYDVKIVDEKPGPDTPLYSGIIIGGNNSAKAGAALGLDPNIGGIVSGTNCSANPRAVAYAFADSDNVNTFAFETGGNASTINRIRGLCWIVAQETAHAIGLDHSFAYTDDNSSACNDPMTYRFECGGQKFFRNRPATCGEFVEQGARPCNCGGGQNTHSRMEVVYGKGTSLIPPPSSVITEPAASSTAANSLGTQVLGSAGSARGVSHVELWINGFKWADVKGASFGRNGQPDPSQYQLLVPTDLPDSIVDVQLKAYDDLGLVGESPVVTVVKGKAGGCTAATECAEGQKCEAGKCFWDPPTGALGDACSFPQACVSGLCSDTVFQGDGICTQDCVLGLEGACPAGFECIDAGNGNAICFTPSDDGGCCSTSHESPWGAFALGGLVLGLFVIRRKR